MSLNENLPTRSKLEIHLEILRTVRDGTRKPTRIMYATNLSWNTMKRNLVSLVSKGFIREIPINSEVDRRSRRKYEITEKGENVLRYLSIEGDVLDLIKVPHRINVSH